VTKTRVGILISGRGSNMMSLVEAAHAAEYPAQIAVVISNRPEAAGLSWAKSKGIPTFAIDHKSYASRPAFEAAMHAVLTAHDCRLIACCGFMRLMTPGFVDQWHNRMLNIHPALLPAYKGLHTHERALTDGVKIAGCTVHVVRAEMDVGPIIAQAAVAVRDDDSAETLGARVLTAEHVLYPHALALLASGKATIQRELVRTSSDVLPPPALIWPAVE
jgi:phosphoribosylglycinamide formyltransferase 1